MGLQDIIDDVKFDIDETFISSFMMDIIRGMDYLHSTKVHSHGILRSSKCLVDTRLSVKVRVLSFAKRIIMKTILKLTYIFKITSLWNRTTDSLTV